MTAGFIGARGSGAKPTTELTEREEQVLRLVATGYAHKEIASRLSLSAKTVDAHKANAMRKLQTSLRVRF